MNKLIITEKQYEKIKHILIENAISDELGEQNQDSEIYGNVGSTKTTTQPKDDDKTLKIDKNNLTLTLQDTLNLKNSNDSSKSRLRLYKGAIFKAGSNNPDILVSNTKTELVDSEGPVKSTIQYYCKTGKFKKVGSNERYHDDSLEQSNSRKQFRRLCQLSRNPEVVSKPKEGYAFITTKNEHFLKSDTDKILVPKGTSFSYIPDKNGVSFRVRNLGGWFDCKSGKFMTNKKQYDAKYLSEFLVKKFCKTKPIETPKQTASKDGGFKDETQLFVDTDIITDFQNYI